MFLDLDAGMQGRGGVVRENRYARLGDDRAGIHAGIDEMDGAAGRGFAGLQGLPPGFETGELREERGVDIDDAAGEGFEQRSLDHAHIAGEDDEIDTGFPQEADGFGLDLGGELGAEAGFADDVRGNSRLLGEGQDARSLDVAEHEDDLGVESAGRDGIADRAEVRPFAGTEDAKTKFLHSGKGMMPAWAGHASGLPNIFFPVHDPARMSLKKYLEEGSREVDAALNKFLPKATARPATLHKAMRYSLFAGGKRMRPILCLAAAEACGGETVAALPAACAVECIHTYSLIHDDLPCMDDDDFRRGRPTSHKVFGEGVAVLAGDALLTQAFEILAAAGETPRYQLRHFLADLAVAAGSLKLVGGQVADLEGEGKKSTRAELRYIHMSKTAAMIVTSLRLGGMSANATARQLEALTAFGESLGLAFQVIDDILDITQSAEKLGKSAGKDVAAQKTTYPSLIGLEAARKEARKLTAQAHAALELFGKKADRLHELADYLLEREY